MTKEPGEFLYFFFFFLYERISFNLFFSFVFWFAGLSTVVKYQSECILEILEESNQKLQIVFLLIEAIKSPEIICDFFRTLSEEEKFECFRLLAEIKENEVRIERKKKLFSLIDT